MANFTVSALFLLAENTVVDVRLTCGLSIPLVIKAMIGEQVTEQVNYPCLFYVVSKSDQRDFS